jgi:hypothetical protein
MSLIMLAANSGEIAQSRSFDLDDYRAHLPLSLIPVSVISNEIYQMSRSRIRSFLADLSVMITVIVVFE